MSLPLNAIRVFAGVARRRSIRLAAAELFVTPGAVSRQIKALEEHLGIALFERRHRAIVLTPAGDAFLRRVGPALDGIGDAVADLRVSQRPPTSTLTIDATPTFAMHWLIPRLAAFRAAHPDIAVRLLTSQGPVRPAPAIDLHVRRDPGQFGGLSGEACLDEYALPVAAPNCCAQWAEKGGELGSQPLIRMRSRPDLWPRWLASYPIAVPVGYIDLDNTILAIQAAAQGLGIALVPTLFLADLLREGVLAPLPGATPLRSGRYHLLRGLGQSSAATIFADWLASIALPAAPAEPLLLAG